MPIISSLSSFEVKCLFEELHEKQSFEALKRATEQAAQIPPSNNMGGTYLVPPLPPLPVVDDQKTMIDWLAFTSAIGIFSLKILVLCLFPAVAFQDQSHGLPGYPESISLSVDGVPVGVIGYGAKHGKDYVSITGKGCALWTFDFYPHVVDVLQVAEAKIVRCDICMDFYKGELTYDQCKDAWSNEWFRLPKSPVNPAMSAIEPVRGDGVNLGRTMYVGSRKGAKLARCYEKGLEVFARLPDAFREACTDPQELIWGEDQKAPEGTIAKNWLRVEIEFKAVDVVLPYSMLLERDEFFAGAYPMCAQILQISDGKRPKTLPKNEDIENERMFMNAKNGYGNAVHTWRKCGYTDAQILDKIDSGRNNQRMVKAGILAKHQALPDSDIPF